MPTINENLQRLQTCKSNISSAITTKGGTVSSGDGFEEFPADIATIPTTTSIYAFLYLTVDAGATATVSKSGTTLTQTSLTGEELLFEIPDSGTWNISVSKTGETTITDSIVINEQKEYYLNMPFAHVYGVVWDKTSSVMVRTDDAVNFAEPDPYVADGNHPGSSPFDNLYPWNGMTKETIDGNVMVKIPKFYFKWSNTATDGTGTFTLQISDKPQNGFMISPAHRVRVEGDTEKDYVYIGRYHCAEDTSDTSNKYKSLSGKTPIASMTRATARTQCEALGAGYHQLDISLWITIWMLYLVEFANWDSQAVIGYGCGNGSTKENSGASDSMPYHTGTMKTVRTGTDAYGVGVQYRNIEDPWGNVVDFCDGIMFSSSSVYLYDTFSHYSDSSSTGRTAVGTRPTSGNYIKDFEIRSSYGGYEWFMYPKIVNSAGYVPDKCTYNSSGVVLRVGGSYNQNQNNGLFNLDGNDTVSVSGGYLGARLQYIPS